MSQPSLGTKMVPVSPLETTRRVSPFYRRLNEIIAEVFSIERQCDVCRSVLLIDHTRTRVEREGHHERKVIVDTITCCHCFQKYVINTFGDWSTVMYTHGNTSDTFTLTSTQGTSTTDNSTIWTGSSTPGSWPPWVGV